MTTLNVGQGKAFSTIAAAVAASRDGDLVAVDAGTYVNDFATINTKITIAAVGGTAHLLATAAPPNGKAILVTNTDVTLDRLEFSGAAVPDGNGAGIRYQGGSLVISNSYFHHNQEGLLSGDVPGGSITIRDSEFAFNGTGDGRTHNLYVGQIGTLTIEGSYFHDAVVGHQIKSRADATIIRDSRVVDGPGGTGSYSIDMPNGGRAVLTGNLIEQGARSGNPVIVAFGEEGNVRAGSSLEMRGNTFVNDLVSPSTKLLWNATDAVAELSGNQVFGLTPGQYGSGPIQLAGMTVLAARPDGAAGAAAPVSVQPPSVETATPSAPAVTVAIAAAVATPPTVTPVEAATAAKGPGILPEAAQPPAVLEVAPPPAAIEAAALPAAIEVAQASAAIEAAQATAVPEALAQPERVAAVSPDVAPAEAPAEVEDWEAAIAVALAPSPAGVQPEGIIEPPLADAPEQDFTELYQAALQEIADFATSGGTVADWDAVLTLLSQPPAGQGDFVFG